MWGKQTHVIGTSLYWGWLGWVLPSSGVWVTVGMDLFTRTCLFSTRSPGTQHTEFNPHTQNLTKDINPIPFPILLICILFNQWKAISHSICIMLHKYLHLWSRIQQILAPLLLLCCALMKWIFALLTRGANAISVQDAVSPNGLPCFRIQHGTHDLVKGLVSVAS